MDSWNKRVEGRFVLDNACCPIDSPLRPSLDLRINQLIGEDSKVDDADVTEGSDTTDVDAKDIGGQERKQQ